MSDPDDEEDQPAEYDPFDEQEEPDLEEDDAEDDDETLWDQVGDAPTTDEDGEPERQPPAGEPWRSVYVKSVRDGHM